VNEIGCSLQGRESGRLQGGHAHQKRLFDILLKAMTTKPMMSAHQRTTRSFAKKPLSGLRFWLIPTS
jgi:hypothetical protein